MKNTNKPRKLKLWKARVRKVYSSLNELEHYDMIYGVANRCGYDSAAELWADNPMLQFSMNPADFGLADLLNNKFYD